MFPCCQLSGFKYIKEDLEIDQARIKKAAKLVSDGDKKSAEKILEEPCRCECHVDGIDCMH